MKFMTLRVSQADYDRLMRALAPLADVSSREISYHYALDDVRADLQQHRRDIRDLAAALRSVFAPVIEEAQK